MHACMHTMIPCWFYKRVFVMYLCPVDVNCTDGSLRLYNAVTTVEGEGAVQICYDSTWYAVCNYHWHCANANVACRELGYTNGASM